jgi:hypothetical protein
MRHREGVVDMVETPNAGAERVEVVPDLFAMTVKVAL